MKESQLHQAFAKYLDREKLPFVHSRTDKRHTNAVGDPDFFVLLAGRVLAIEFKVGSNKLSEAQTKRIEYLRRAGISVKILASVEQAVSAVQTWLGVETEEGGDAACGASKSLKDSEEGKESVSNAAPTFQPESAANLFIGNISGRDHVLSGDSGPGGSARVLRVATPADLINLPRR